MNRRWGDLAATGRSGSSQHDWADGYVVDTPYFEPATTDVCPAWLSMVSVLHGQPPLDLSRPLTWMDLGAASGISACMVGASNPNVEVWGFDHNPGHVERARSLSHRADLTNCHFEEASFATLATDDGIGPAQADVIVVSGVYSWISRENQGHVVEVIRRRLKPGGLAYVMYEAATGWSSMVPLTEALRLLTEADGRRGDLAFHDAADVVRQLREAGAHCFPIGSREQVQMDGWPTANGFYAAHEYLGRHFGPLLFDDVANALAGARCSYLGLLDPIGHLRDYWAPPALADVVTTATDVTTRELLRDVIGQRPLRRDLYRRGLAAATPQQHEADQLRLRVVGLGKPFDDKPVDLLVGGVRLDRAYYEPLVGALLSQPLDVETIGSIHTDWTLADAASALAMLVAGGYAAPALSTEPTVETRAACRRLTDLLIAENRAGADHGIIVSPTLGSGFDADAVGVLALGAVRDGAGPDEEALADLVLAQLDRMGRTIRDGGAVLDDPDEARRVAVERVRRVLRVHDALGA